MNASNYNPIVTAFENSVIESTEWFKFAKKEPGQPGVFEVDPVPVDDFGSTVSRFAYWNGRFFGPAAGSPETAYAARFEGKAGFVSKFRGLIQQA